MWFCAMGRLPRITSARVSALLLALLLPSAAVSDAVELEARIKWFGTATMLDEEDIQRRNDGTPQFDQNYDARVMLNTRRGPFELVFHHTTGVVQGDAVRARSRNRGLVGGTTLSLDQTPRGDERRVMDLTRDIDDGDHHESFHRIDRLALKAKWGNWSVTVGRDAVSWGNGIVFQPADLFTPFAPTAVDRDFKAGEDLVHVQRLFDNGSDIEFLAVGRRDADGDVTGQAGSAALKWHGFAGIAEIEAFAAKHYRDDVLGFSLRLPIGSALMRTDIVATKLSESFPGRQWRYSGILNLDYSFDVLGKSVYVFGEYYHNGFGVTDISDPALLPTALNERLLRGEVFNLMRDYAAIGGNVQWHALLTQNLTVLANLHDGSHLAQTSFAYNPGDHQQIEAGVVAPLGVDGEEFGAIPLVTLPTGDLVTAGSGVRAFVRWVYYF